MSEALTLATFLVQNMPGLHRLKMAKLNRFQWERPWFRYSYPFCGPDPSRGLTPAEEWQMEFAAWVMDREAARQRQRRMPRSRSPPRPFDPTALDDN